MTPEPVTGLWSFPRVELAERGRVHVERLDGDGDLVLPEREGRIEGVGALRERAARGDHAAEAVGIHRPSP
jgi:hypothetical protein